MNSNKLHETKNISNSDKLNTDNVPNGDVLRKNILDDILVLFVPDVISELILSYEYIIEGKISSIIKIKDLIFVLPLSNGNLFTTSLEGVAQIWDTKTGQLIYTIKETFVGILDIDTTPTNKILLLTLHKLIIIDGNTGLILLKISHENNNMLLLSSQNPSQNIIVTYSIRKMNIILYDELNNKYIISGSDDFSDNIYKIFRISDKEFFIILEDTDDDPQKHRIYFYKYTDKLHLSTSKPIPYIKDITTHRVDIFCSLKTEKYIIIAGQIKDITKDYTEGYLIIFNIQTKKIYKTIIFGENIYKLCEINNQIICFNINNEGNFISFFRLNIHTGDLKKNYGNIRYAVSTFTR